MLYRPRTARRWFQSIHIWSNTSKDFGDFDILNTSTSLHLEVAQSTSRLRSGGAPARDVDDASVARRKLDHPRSTQWQCDWRPGSLKGQR